MFSYVFHKQNPNFFDWDATAGKTGLLNLLCKKLLTSKRNKKHGGFEFSKQFNIISRNNTTYKCIYRVFKKYAIKMLLHKHMLVAKQ